MVVHLAWLPRCSQSVLCAKIGSIKEKRWDNSPQSGGTNCPNVLEDEQVGKISQVEQKSWDSGKRKEFMTFGRWGGQLRTTARMS